MEGLTEIMESDRDPDPSFTIVAAVHEPSRHALPLRQANETEQGRAHGARVSLLSPRAQGGETQPASDEEPACQPVGRLQGSAGLGGSFSTKRDLQSRDASDSLSRPPPTTVKFYFHFTSRVLFPFVLFCVCVFFLLNLESGWRLAGSPEN